MQLQFPCDTPGVHKHTTAFQTLNNRLKLFLYYFIWLLPTTLWKYRLYIYTHQVVLQILLKANELLIGTERKKEEIFGLLSFFI